MVVNPLNAVFTAPQVKAIEKYVASVLAVKYRPQANTELKQVVENLDKPERVAPKKVKVEEVKE